MKTKLPALSNAKQALAVRAEQSLMEQLPLETKTLRKVAKYLEPKRLKFIVLAAAGGAALLSALGSIGHERLYRSAVARELKRQLEPINSKLDRLEAENKELKQQNEEMQKRLTQ